MSIFRRTEDVLEIQEGPSTSIRGKAACDLMQDNKLPFITLLSMKTWVFAYVQFLKIADVFAIFEINSFYKHDNCFI